MQSDAIIGNQRSYKAIRGHQMVLDTAPILTDEGAQPGKVDIAVVGQVALEARGDSELIPAIGEASREAIREAIRGHPRASERPSERHSRRPSERPSGTPSERHSQ